MPDYDLARPTCRNGHPDTPGSRYTNGTCRRCRADRNQRYFDRQRQKLRVFDSISELMSKPGGRTPDALVGLLASLSLTEFESDRSIAAR